MEEKYCQSCGMPLHEEDGLYGTEKDGSVNKDYCKYCYQDGAFTSDCTMEEMIRFCIPHMTAEGSDMNAQQAEAMMQAFFPTLKRWK